MSFLGQKDWSDLHTLAVCVLGLLLEEAESMAALQGSGLLQQLLAHVRESELTDVKKQSVSGVKSFFIIITNCVLYAAQDLG